MTKRFNNTFVILVFCLIILKFCPVYAASDIPTGIILPKFKMTMPDSRQSRDYLGIQDAKIFTLSDINAKLIIVELFSTVCPKCHAQTPVANNLYKLIEGNPELKKDVKMVGIGLMSQPKALDAYIKKFNVPFPFIDDSDSHILTSLKVEQIPQTLLIDKNGKVLSNHPGVIHNIDDFLRDIRKHLKNQ